MYRPEQYNVNERGLQYPPPLQQLPPLQQPPPLPPDDVSPTNMFQSYGVLPLDRPMIQTNMSVYPPPSNTLRNVPPLNMSLPPPSLPTPPMGPQLNSDLCPSHFVEPPQHDAWHYNNYNVPYPQPVMPPAMGLPQSDLSYQPPPDFSQPPPLLPTPLYPESNYVESVTAIPHSIIETYPAEQTLHTEFNMNSVGPMQHIPFSSHGQYDNEIMSTPNQTDLRKKAQASRSRSSRHDHYSQRDCEDRYEPENRSYRRDRYEKIHYSEQRRSRPQSSERNSGQYRDSRSHSPGRYRESRHRSSEKSPDRYKESRYRSSEKSPDPYKESRNRSTEQMSGRTRESRQRSPKRISHQHRSPKPHKSDESPGRCVDSKPRSSDKSCGHYRDLGRRSSERNSYHYRKSRQPTPSRSERNSKHRSSPSRERKPLSDKEIILEKFRKNYCSTKEQLMQRMKNIERDEDIDITKESAWYRSSPADLYYSTPQENGVLTQTVRLDTLCDEFTEALIKRGHRARPEVDELPPLKTQPRLCNHDIDHSSSSSSDEDEVNLDDDRLKGEADRVMMELQRKQKHPRRLHPEMWYNNPGEMNGGPLCRCNERARRKGMRHGVFAGEPSFLRCNLKSNNYDKLFHYRLTVSPSTNFLIRTPTIITHDEHEFLFSGFSMFSHYKLNEVPNCKVIRFNIEYTILYVEEPAPKNFTIQELDLFETFLFSEILELVDLDLGKATDSTCSQFHFMPRFVRNLQDGGSEILSMCHVLMYLLQENHLLISPDDLKYIHSMDLYRWHQFIDKFKGTIVTNPGKKPCSIRIDQLDRSPPDNKHSKIVRHGSDESDTDSVSSSRHGGDMSVHSIDTIPEKGDNPIDQPETVHQNIEAIVLVDASENDCNGTMAETIKSDFINNSENSPQNAKEDCQEAQIRNKIIEENSVHSKHHLTLDKQVIDNVFDISNTDSQNTDPLKIYAQGPEQEEIMIGPSGEPSTPTEISRQDREEKSPDIVSKNDEKITEESESKNPNNNSHRQNYSRKEMSGNKRDKETSKYGERKRRRLSERNTEENSRYNFYPEIVHFGIRPPQLSYAGNPEYQKAWRFYVKYRHLVANLPKPGYKEKQKLQEMEEKLQQMRTQTKMKRGVTVAISSEGFYTTGIMCDIVQHAMLIPVLVRHLRFHKSLDSLETKIKYKFKSRSLLQKGLTHPSFRENYGTNPDHAKNSLTNCGIRQPEYGDRKIHYTNTRKKGINILIGIMSRFGEKSEKESAINHNERLEFLGDAVVEFLSSIHLFRMFPGLAEGGLATYRAAIVQNQHLALLAEKIGLEQYMLFAHGSDLCREIVMRHAMANCFEALLGAVYLDGDLQAADDVFALALWLDMPIHYKVWSIPRMHPLQELEPLGDRHYVEQFEFLQKLVEFEKLTNIKFTHIRLLARAFTDRSVGFTNLTLGSNQRLEFLGDTVLQLVVSAQLYKHFPEHHEGHLSLLRSSLVNNRTQAHICDDLGMGQYALYNNPKTKPTTRKHKADLLEAFLGALYIDKGLVYCQAFCNAVLFPRLKEFIMNQDWNDPKSKLQQCCLTLRTMKGGEPDIPVYKVIQSLGPTNTRVYTVAVYFRGSRLASGKGLSIQDAEMNAAKEALNTAQQLFPQLDHQKRVVAKAKNEQGSTSSSGQPVPNTSRDRNRPMSDKTHHDRMPKAYRPREEETQDESSDDEVVMDVDMDVTDLEKQAANLKEKSKQDYVSLLRDIEIMDSGRTIKPLEVELAPQTNLEKTTEEVSVERSSDNDGDVISFTYNADDSDSSDYETVNEEDVQ